MLRLILPQRRLPDRASRTAQLYPEGSWAAI